MGVPPMSFEGAAASSRAYNKYLRGRSARLRKIASAVALLRRLISQRRKQGQDAHATEHALCRMRPSTLHPRPSRQQPLHHLPVHVGQPELPALILERELLVVQPQEVQHGGV